MRPRCTGYEQHAMLYATGSFKNMVHEKWFVNTWFARMSIRPWGRHATNHGLNKTLFVHTYCERSGQHGYITKTSDSWPPARIYYKSADARPPSWIHYKSADAWPPAWIHYWRELWSISLFPVLKEALRGIYAQDNDHEHFICILVSTI